MSLESHTHTARPDGGDVSSHGISFRTAAALLLLLTVVAIVFASVGLRILARNQKAREAERAIASGQYARAYERLTELEQVGAASPWYVPSLYTSPEFSRYLGDRWVDRPGPLPFWGFMALHTNAVNGRIRPDELKDLIARLEAKIHASTKPLPKDRAGYDDASYVRTLRRLLDPPAARKR
jgi:hypothetical protein